MTMVLLCFLAAPASAQHPTCDGNRYVNEVFPTVDIINGIQYGQNTTIGGNNRDLFLNIYQPAGDTASIRPLVVFVHGGGFVGGNRGDMSFLCGLFARRGFVTATIDYRLIDAAIADSFQLADVVSKAVSDMRAAIRFFREDAATANLYRIDPDYIFGGGISAGGVTALHTAYLDSLDNIPAYVQTAIDNNGGFSGNSSSNTQYSSAVQGVLNYSGSISRDHWVGPGSVPLYSAHDDMDPVVPFGYGQSSAFPFPAYSYGSGAIEITANNAGVTNQIFTVSNSNGHVSYFFNSNAAIVIQESATFLNDILCGTTTAIAGGPAGKPVEALNINLFPNPTNAEINIRLNRFSSGYSVDIFNVLGERVFQTGGRSEILQINTESFPSGIYFVRVQLNNPPSTAAANIVTRQLYLVK